MAAIRALASGAVPFGGSGQPSNAIAIAIMNDAGRNPKRLSRLAGTSYCQMHIAAIRNMNDAGRNSKRLSRLAGTSYCQVHTIAFQPLRGKQGPPDQIGTSSPDSNYFAAMAAIRALASGSVPFGGSGQPSNAIAIAIIDDAGRSPKRLSRLAGASYCQVHTEMAFQPIRGKQAAGPDRRKLAG